MRQHQRDQRAQDAARVESPGQQDAAGEGDLVIEIDYRDGYIHQP